MRLLNHNHDWVTIAQERTDDGFYAEALQVCSVCGKERILTFKKVLVNVRVGFAPMPVQDMYRPEYTWRLEKTIQFY